MGHRNKITTKNKSISLVKVSSKNMRILLNLALAYEAEFSPITKKMPDKYGKIDVDVLPKPPHIGYLLYYKKIPVGFCVVDTKSAIKDIAEFYIMPIMRKKHLGYLFATTIFDLHPGEWQARQIKGADHAIKFCRFVIRKYTGNRYTEKVVNDKYWGKVTRQRFRTKRSA